MNVNESFRKKEPRSSWIYDLAVAGTFLTCLPFRPSPSIKISDLGPSVRMFPILGLIVGIIGSLVLWIAAQINLNSSVYGFAGLATITLITGALHEDGLADFSDGITARSRSRRLEIMRDPKIGTFGVLALIFCIGLKVGVLGNLAAPNLAMKALIVAAVISRGMMPLIMYFMKPAQPDGLGHDAGRPTARRMLTALIFSAGIGFIALEFWNAIFALILSATVVLAIGLLAHRRLAGYTGDVLGAAQQCAEITVLIVIGATTL